MGYQRDMKGELMLGLGAIGTIIVILILLKIFGVF